MAEKVQSKHRESFVSGIIRQNPLFISMLGTCPALAVTTSIESAFGMGLLFTFVLLCSNVIISLLKKLIPEVVHTPCYIVVIAAFVTITKMFTEAFLPELYSTLGVFLSLLVVNCIVLGRAEAFANKNTVANSFLDAIGNGIGYTLAICIIAFFREALGTGGITIGKIFTFLPQFTLPLLKYPGTNIDMSMSVFTDSAGGFIVMGLALAVIMAIENKKNTKKKVDVKIKMQQEMAAKKAAAAKAAAAKSPAPAVATANAAIATPVAETKKEEK